MLSARYRSQLVSFVSPPLTKAGSMRIVSSECSQAGIIEYRYEPERAFLSFSLLLDFSFARAGFFWNRFSPRTGPRADRSFVARPSWSPDLDSSRIRVAPVSV